MDCAYASNGRVYIFMENSLTLSFSIRMHNNCGFGADHNRNRNINAFFNIYTYINQFQNFFFLIRKSRKMNMSIIYTYVHM